MLFFSGRESHYPHAPSNGIVMMDKRHCCLSSSWSSSMRSVRFTTLFWNQSAFHLNDLFSSFESTGNTHHGFWFTPRGIQCKYPWWNLSAWCKYLRANQCKYPCHFTTWCKYLRHFTFRCKYPCHFTTQCKYLCCFPLV